MKLILAALAAWHVQVTPTGVTVPPRFPAPTAGVLQAIQSKSFSSQDLCWKAVGRFVGLTIGTGTDQDSPYVLYVLKCVETE